MSERLFAAPTGEKNKTRSIVLQFEDNLLAAHTQSLGVLAHPGFNTLPLAIKNAQLGFATDQKQQPARRQFYLDAAQSQLDDLREWQDRSLPETVFHTIVPAAVSSLEQGKWNQALAQTVALERHLQAGHANDRWPHKEIRFQRRLIDNLLLKDLLAQREGLSMSEQDLDIIPALITGTLKLSAVLVGLNTCPMYSREQAQLRKAFLHYTAEHQQMMDRCVDFLRRSTGPDTERLERLINTLNRNAAQNYGLALPLIER